VRDDAKSEVAEVRYEPDTGFVYCIYPPGTIRAPTARRIVEAVAPYQALGATFILLDVRHVTGIDREAREVFGSVERGEHHTYNATFGAPLAIRAITNLIAKATSRFVKHVVRHEPDEAAARAWLTDQRRSYLARQAGS